MYSNNKKEHSSEPPQKITNVQRLMDIINNRRDCGKKQPYGMPDKQQEAAQWFIGLIEPRMWREADELKLAVRGDKKGQQYWVLPYQDRLAECLVAYYILNNGDQKYILGLIEKGIAWRGDSVEFMRVREKVTPEFLDDKKKLKSMLKSMVGAA